MRLMATFSFLGLQYAACTTAVAPLPEEKNITFETITLEEQRSFWLLETTVKIWQLNSILSACEMMLNLNRN